jgi:Zn-dependent protease with chaperone function
MLLLAVSVLAQGALFVYSIYTIEVIAIQRVHGGILLAVGLGAVAACWVLLKSSLAFLKREPMFIRAIALDRQQHPGFFSFVEQIAEKLSAQKPDNIVVGLEPNFFVTASDVKLIGQDAVLKGRTLFVSASLLHVFSKDELASVVGHELGHFRGEDVAYSMKFAPTYTRLGQALAVLGQASGSAADLGRLPAQVALSMCFMEFASAERSVGRERELLADKAGAQAATAQALARALVKLSLFAPQWGALTNAHTDELAKGRTFTNLAQTYAGVCTQVAADLNWTVARDELGKSVQSHPIDTHPPLLTRLQNLKTTLYELDPAELGTPDIPASTLLTDADQIEEALSTLEAQWLVAIRAVVLPDPETT